MNFKHELSPSKPLLRSTQSLILGLYTQFLPRPAKKESNVPNLRGYCLHIYTVVSGLITMYYHSPYLLTSVPSLSVNQKMSGTNNILFI